IAALARTAAKEIIAERVLTDVSSAKLERGAASHFQTKSGQKVKAYAAPTDAECAFTELLLSRLGHDLGLPVVPVLFSWDNEALHKAAGTVYSIKCFKPAITLDVVAFKKGSSRKEKRFVSEIRAPLPEREEILLHGCLRQTSALLPFWEWTGSLDVGI